MQLKEAKQFHTASDGKQQRGRRYRAISKWRRNSGYGSPPCKARAVLRFLSLRRDFLQDCSRSKAALKPKSLTIRCC